MMLHLNDHADDRVVPFRTEVAFCAWVGQAAPGDRFEYHRGFLGIDMTAATLPEAERQQVKALARTAYRACEAGLVDLIQVRIGTEHFAYVAIARSKPRGTPIPLGSLLADREDAR